MATWKDNAVRIEYNRLPQIAKRLPAAASRIVGKTVFRIEQEIKTSMEAPKSGNVYGSHIASAPGEAPAVDMGALINSIQTYFLSGQLAGAVFTTMEYGPHLEFGAPEANLAARPFMGPGADNVEPWFISQMKHLEKELK